MVLYNWQNVFKIITIVSLKPGNNFSKEVLTKYSEETMTEKV